MTSLLEINYVKNFYNNHAAEFDATRYAPWPIVKNFIDDLPQGTCILDVGSGNGKNQYRDDLYWTSCDNSIEMCKRSKNAVLCECTSLPFESNSYDAVICIAVLHHLDSVQKRKDAINEIFRVLKPNGKFIISVWGAQKKYGSGDQFVKWKTNETLRYIHFFTEDEVNQLFDKQINIVCDYNNYYINGIN